MPPPPPPPPPPPGLFDGTPLQQPVTCERCGKPHAACACPRGLDGKVLDPATQQVRVRREKRNGKTVTVVAGLAPRSERTDELPDLLKALKKKLGTGGSLSTITAWPTSSQRGATRTTTPTIELELQGDHRDAMVQHFTALGYPTKPAGG